MKGLERFIGGPLGMGNAFGPMKKEWVGAAISGLVGIGSTIFGGATSANARKKAQAIESGIYARDYARNLREYYQRPTERLQDQALIKEYKDYARKAFQREKGAEAVAGGTSAATQMQKDSLNSGMAKTVRDVAAMGESRQEHALDAMRQADRERARSQAGFEIEKANNTAAVASGLSNAAMQLGGAFEKSQSLQGGSNNSQLEKDEDYQKIQGNGVV